LSAAPPFASHDPPWIQSLHDLISPQDAEMGRWSCILFVVLILCGAFIREAHQATTSDVGGHKGAQRHLLIQSEDDSNRNGSALERKLHTLPSSNYLQPGVFEEL